MKIPKNEVVNVGTETLKSLIMQLAYGEGESDDFDSIVAINETLKVLLDEVAAIEADRDQYKEAASRLRNDRTIELEWDKIDKSSVK